jgi:hypothetical protein
VPDLPGHERREERRARRHERRLVHRGDTYTIDEDLEGEIELEEVEPDPDPPPEEVRGEPWGWTKPGPRPRGWRKDGQYGPAEGVASESE